METLELSTLDSKDVEELQQIARDLNIDPQTHRKQDLVLRIIECQTEASGFKVRQGVLEILPDGWGSCGDATLSLPLTTSTFPSHNQALRLRPATRLLARFGLRKTGEVLRTLRVELSMV